MKERRQEGQNLRDLFKTISREHDESLIQTLGHSVFFRSEEMADPCFGQRLRMGSFQRFPLLASTTSILLEY